MLRGDRWRFRGAARPGQDCTRCVLRAELISWGSNRNRRIRANRRLATQGGNMNIRETVPPITELEKISTRTDTRDYLAKAAPTTEKLKDWLGVDFVRHAYAKDRFASGYV